jgi:N-formylglutamate deformylase
MSSFIKNTEIKSPILISMPHCGEYIPDDEKQYYLDHAFLIEDTDWFIPKLYHKAVTTYDLNFIENQVSRFVIDVNRPESDESLYPGQITTGLFPTESFDGTQIYRIPLTDEQKKHRIQKYWQPYHQSILQTLSQIKDKYGYAILWDAHSIRSQVPRLFEGTLTDFNFGSFDGKSCLIKHRDLLTQTIQKYPQYSHVFNGRFKGGYITRHYGKPDQNIYAIQLELSQKTYLQDENAKFQHKIPQWDHEYSAQVQDIICDLIHSLL